MKESKLQRHGLWTRRRRHLVWCVIIYVILTAGAVVLMLPLGWMASTSLKESSAVFIFPPEWIPKPAVWGNYVKALTIRPFHLYFFNTLIITVLFIVGACISCSMVAFGFARMRFPGRDFLFMVLLSTMMLPRIVMMIPVYILFTKLRWINTFKPLIVPAFFGIAFYIFLLRQFFLTIPFELEYAARIDGCKTVGIFLRIILPLAKPALAAVTIFSFVSNWNDFMGPLIYLNSMNKWTLALGLQAFKGQWATDWNLMMAAALVVMVPTLVVFFFGQKYFIRGIVFTGMK